MRKVITVVGLVILVAAVGVGAAVLLKGNEVAVEPESVAVSVASPQRGDLTVLINAPGEVEPLTKVALGAKVTARIVELPFLEGQSVTKGAPDADPPVPPSVLVRLDAADLEAALVCAEARRASQAAQIEVERHRLASKRSELDAMETALLRAGRDLDRCKELYESKFKSRAELDDAQSRHDELKARHAATKHASKAAEANLEVMRHNLEAAAAETARARDALSYTTITSPIDGIVTRVNGKVGELVVTGTVNTPGTVIMEVADLSRMYVVARIDEADIGRLAVAQRAVVRVHAYPDDKFDGMVKSVALSHDVTSEGIKYFKAKILFDSSRCGGYAGLTADVDIEAESYSGVLKIPSKAILARAVKDLPSEMSEGNAAVNADEAFTPVVYRLIDGKAVVTPVEIGGSDENHTVIRSGLTQDDEVVIGPYRVLDSIAHGQSITSEGG